MKILEIFIKCNVIMVGAGAGTEFFDKMEPEPYKNGPAPQQCFKDTGTGKNWLLPVVHCNYYRYQVHLFWFVLIFTENNPLSFDYGIGKRMKFRFISIARSRCKFVLEVLTDRN
jgi:hypothetical protein